MDELNGSRPMAVDYATHYAELEKDLVGLVQKYAHLLTTADLAQATQFLAAREYALALEEIVAALVDQKIGIDPVQAEHMAKLGKKMHIEARPFMQVLNASLH
jgi:hypothetical protein